MKEPEKIINNNLSSDLLMLLGGIGCIIFGVYALVNPNGYDIDKGDIPNWAYGMIFLPAGLYAIINLLDFYQLKIKENEIEIKSLFRKRIILKEDILAYEIGEYTGKHGSGERIRIFCKKGNYKFHTTQLKSIKEIKKFVEGKEVREKTFEREENFNLMIVGIFLVMILSYLCMKMAAMPAKEVEVEAIGIPASYGKDLNIIEENEDVFKLTLEEYKNYLFIVDKESVPKNMRTTEKKLVLFIDNKEDAQELLKKEPLIYDSDNPKEIIVDGIQILE